MTAFSTTMSEENCEEINLSIDVLELKESVQEDNAAWVKKVEDLLRAHHVFLVNVMSTPGAGKTSTLVRTIEMLKGQYRIGVLEADVDAVVDADTVEKAGAKALQIHTGGSCHMDAKMTYEGLVKLGLDDVDLVFLENVGNLVCPAEFDVGAQLKAMILSVPEGDDKPLKYPLMFQVSDVMLINKIDVMPVFDFDVEKAKKRVKELNPDIEVFEISAKTGAGVDAWVNDLQRRVMAE